MHVYEMVKLLSLLMAMGIVNIVKPTNCRHQTLQIKNNTNVELHWIDPQQNQIIYSSFLFHRWVSIEYPLFRFSFWYMCKYCEEIWYALACIYPYQYHVESILDPPASGVSDHLGQAFLWSSLSNRQKWEAK